MLSLAARDREESIAVKHFESHVQQMHAGKNFETEYMVRLYPSVSKYPSDIRKVYLPPIEVPSDKNL